MAATSTPVPWQFNKLTGEISDGQGAEVCGPVDCYDEEKWKADARLIVRAVNAHESFVHALNEAAEGLDWLVPAKGDCKCSGSFVCVGHSALKIVRDALAKADRS